MKKDINKINYEMKVTANNNAEATFEFHGDNKDDAYCHVWQLARDNSRMFANLNWDKKPEGDISSAYVRKIGAIHWKKVELKFGY